MCTLALVVPAPGGTLQVGANRDESLSRPAAPPHRWDGREWLAPKDLEAGGTWLGINAQGLFVGVTNRAGAPRQPGKRSRGLLVTDALSAPDARSLHAQLAALPVEQFNAFHLAYADGTWAGVTWSDGRRLAQDALPPGVHVLTERSFGAGNDGTRVDRLQEQLATGGVLSLEAWLGLLSVHGPTPRESTCVHADPVGYGTRSAFVLHRAPTLEQSACTWTEGRPCTTPAQSGTKLLQALGRW
jgi:Transport and Golgi organisation 2